MPTIPTVILCTDGSEHCLEALAAGLVALTPEARTVVLTVVEEPDPGLIMGASGFAGGTMSAETYDALRAETYAAGESLVADTVRALGLGDVEHRVVSGPAGPAIVDLAAQEHAAAVVMGSRGRSGVKRAILGSVSDHVVRHAPCPVVITSARGTHESAPR